MKNKVIPSSELIINADGSVFHLHLHPQQLTDRIILVGDPGRVDMVAANFDTRDFEVSSREFHTIGGTYKGKPIMCLSHGIGPDNIDIVATELDALANVDFSTRQVRSVHRQLTMVRIGTSGALQPDLIVGTPVIAEKLSDLTVSSITMPDETRSRISILKKHSANIHNGIRCGQNPMLLTPMLRL